MRFHREQFMNTPDDADWLRTTHLKSVAAVPPFASFTLAGSEDAPVRLDLYASNAPEYNEKPVAVYEIESVSGDLMLKVKGKQ